MKLKNKKFRIFSAIASMSAVATLASVSITSCAKNANAETNTSANTADERDNGVYSTVTFNGNEGIIKGDVSVKVRTGKPFGSIKAPIATRDGYAFDG
ncbi:MAG: InlB B-repeat-containing protein [Mycoplasmoidaceae bacterium]|nr:InlB B-repeat-containing protein [Mycoplasmoidaceae bacterium]